MGNKKHKGGGNIYNLPKSAKQRGENIVTNAVGSRTRTIIQGKLSPEKQIKENVKLFLELWEAEIETLPNIFDRYLLKVDMRELLQALLEKEERQLRSVFEGAFFLPFRTLVEKIALLKSVEVQEETAFYRKVADKSLSENFNEGVSRLKKAFLEIISKITQQHEHKLRIVETMSRLQVERENIENEVDSICSLFKELDLLLKDFEFYLHNNDDVSVELECENEDTLLKDFLKTTSNIVAGLEESQLKLKEVQSRTISCHTKIMSLTSEQKKILSETEKTLRNLDTLKQQLLPWESILGVMILDLDDPYFAFGKHREEVHSMFDTSDLNYVFQLDVVDDTRLPSNLGVRLEGILRGIDHQKMLMQRAGKRVVELSNQKVKKENRVFTFSDQLIAVIYGSTHHGHEKESAYNKLFYGHFPQKYHSLMVRLGLNKQDFSDFRTELLKLTHGNKALVAINTKKAPGKVDGKTTYFYMLTEYGVKEAVSLLSDARMVYIVQKTYNLISLLDKQLSR